MFVQSLVTSSRSVHTATQADAVDATCDLVAGGSGADGGDGRPPGLRRMMRGAGGVRQSTESRVSKVQIQYESRREK